MSLADYVMRAAGPADLGGFKQLREIAGPGFTSLMLDDAALKAKLELSADSFARDIQAPGAERYFIALEHSETKAIAGCVGIKATIGTSPPFFNFRVIRKAQSSSAADRRFDLDVLIGVNDFIGCTEVGSLFVRPEHRAPGVGRMLAQSRYMLMATQPTRFHAQVISELRGVVSADGVSPFWEAVGRHFFRMDFNDADRLSATTDNQFILDLMPQHPIYVDLLPEDARAVIGQCHDAGRGARALLEWEGFTFSDVVDIFDAGPLLGVSRDAIRTLRQSRQVQVSAGVPGESARRALSARPETRGFRCVATRAVAKEGVAIVEAPALATLGLDPGAQALIWLSDAD